MPPKAAQQRQQQLAPGEIDWRFARKVALVTAAVTLFAALLLELAGGPLGLPTRTRDRFVKRFQSQEAEDQQQQKRAENETPVNLDSNTTASKTQGKKKLSKTKITVEALHLPVEALRSALRLFQQKGMSTDDDDETRDDEASNDIAMLHSALGLDEAKFLSDLKVFTGHRTGKEEKALGYGAEDKFKGVVAITRYLEDTLIPAWKDQPSEELFPKYEKSGIIQFLDEVTRVVVERSFIPPSEGAGSSVGSSSVCDCGRGSWPKALHDLSLALADSWFALDDEVKHQKILYSLLSSHRPWIVAGYSDHSGVCDADSVQVCESTRSFLLEELIALEPTNYLYRSLYAVSLVFGKGHYEESVVFLERYQQRMEKLVQVAAEDDKVKSKYTEQYLLLHGWTYPLINYAKLVIEEMEHDVPPAEDSPEVTRLCESLLRTPAPKSRSLLLEEQIGFTLAEVMQMATYCGEVPEVEKHLRKQLSPTSSVGAPTAS